MFENTHMQAQRTNYSRETYVFVIYFRSSTKRQTFLTVPPHICIATEGRVHVSFVCVCSF